MLAESELQQQQQQTLQKQHGSLLSEYGALLMQHCCQIQQALQDASPVDTAVGGDIEGNDGKAGETVARLRSALRVLALHSVYSGRFFDLFKSELRIALTLEMGEQAKLAQHREASLLLKEVCLRSKEMSHDVIKASRELVHAFKAELRVDDRRRSGSILSRARDIAKATIRRGSSSRAAAAVASAEPSAQEAAVRQQVLTQQTTPLPKTTPLSHLLVDLERSPRARSPRLDGEDEQNQQAQKPPSTAGQRGPAPPRRSSSLNSLPPEQRVARPMEMQEHQHQHQHQHQRQRQQQTQQHQPHGGTLSSRFQCTENCVKTVLSAERHQLVRPVQPQLQPQPQQVRPASVSKTPRRSVGSPAASSAATADLPSEATSTSEEEPAEGKVRNKGKKCENRNDKVTGTTAAGAMKKLPLPDRKPQHCSVYATTDMDVRLSELDEEDTVTKVTELAYDENSYFNNTSDILSTSTAADWARQVAAPVAQALSGRMAKLRYHGTTASAEPAETASEATAEATAATSPRAVADIVRQRKLPPGAATAAASTAAAALSVAVGGASSKSRVHHRKRRQLGGRKAPPASSVAGSRQTQLHHHHHRQQGRSQQQQSRNMFSYSSDSSSCSQPPPIRANSKNSKEEAAKAVKATMKDDAGMMGAAGTKLVSGVMETDL